MIFFLYIEFRPREVFQNFTDFGWFSLPERSLFWRPKIWNFKTLPTRSATSLTLAFFLRVYMSKGQLFQKKKKPSTFQKSTVCCWCVVDVLLMLCWCVDVSKMWCVVCFVKFLRKQQIFHNCAYMLKYITCMHRERKKSFLNVFSQILGGV